MFRYTKIKWTKCPIPSQTETVRKLRSTGWRAYLTLMQKLMLLKRKEKVCRSLFLVLIVAICTIDICFIFLLCIFLELSDDEDDTPTPAIPSLMSTPIQRFPGTAPRMPAMPPSMPPMGE